MHKPQRLAFSLLLLGAAAGCGDDAPEPEPMMDAAVQPDPVVRVLFRTDFAPGREFDSYQLELAELGEDVGELDCAREVAVRGELSDDGSPADGSKAEEWSVAVGLLDLDHADLPKQARVTLCKDGEDVSALYKKIALTSQDAGTAGNVVNVPPPEEDPETNVMFTLARNRSITCAEDAGQYRLPTMMCVEMRCDFTPALQIPHDEDCAAGEICDVRQGCIPAP